MKTEEEIRRALVSWRNVSRMRPEIGMSIEMRQEIEQVAHDAKWWADALEWVLGEEGT